MRYSTLIFILCVQYLIAQSDGQSFTLEQIIALSQSDAPEVLLEKTELSRQYWFLQQYKASLRPQINLDATLPNVNHTIDLITLPNGSGQYINRSLMNNDLSLSLNQVLPFSGGRVFLASGLNRLDIFKTSLVQPSVSYLGRPLFVGFTQPLFRYNNWKWDKAIRPLQYAEATKKFSENLESLALKSVTLFFDLLVAQLEEQAVRSNKTNADTLYELNKSRFKVGKIAESELLQSEINSMNTDVDLSQAGLDVSTANEKLRNFLGIQKSISFELITPNDLPDLHIDPNQAIEYARQNRSVFTSHELKRLEAEASYDQAKKNQQANINLSGNLGLTQTGSRVSDALRNPLDQEIIRLDIGIPIADWGKAKANKEIASSNLTLVNQTISQEKSNLEQEISLKVKQFDLKKERVKIAQRASEASQKRYFFSTQRYLIGKVGIVELSQAIDDQNKSRKAYFSALRDYWIAYYEIRKLTLFDFITNEKIKK